MRRFFGAFTLVLGALILVGSPAFAVFTERPDYERKVPAVNVTDDRGRSVPLVSVLAEKKANLILPFYTTCHGVCPLAVQSLRSQLVVESNGAVLDLVNVILVSMSSDDDAESLSEFRDAHKLPGSWKLVTLDDTSRQLLFDQLDFVFRREGSEFVHPDRLYAIGGDGVWVATIERSPFQASEIKKAANLLLARADSPYVMALRAWFLNPNVLVSIGGIGLAILAFLFIMYLAQSKIVLPKSTN